MRLGRRIEAHFGRPQDIEWCRTGDDFAIVQSRPITTLFPIPAATDGQKHVYLSVGHQQMMTDAMKPLGTSVWQMTAMAPMHEAGGRLWVDVAGRVSTSSSRAAMLNMIGQGDPLFRDALETILDTGFLPLEPAPQSPAPQPQAPQPAASPPQSPQTPAPLKTDPAIVERLIARSQASIATLKRDIDGKTGPELFDFMVEAVREHKRILADPLNIQAVMAGMEASWWLNEHLEEWLGEKNAADTLTLSAPGNITSEMGLALLDVADAIRPHPEIVKRLEETGELPEAIEPFLERFGMRCAGEIDITRPRWREQPETLVPVILDNVRNFEPGAAKKRFEEGRQQARAKEEDVLTRLRALPDGDEKATETKRMIDRVRTFIGYREYPKYDIVCRLFVYKQALLREAENLFADREDAFYLTYEELRELILHQKEGDPELIERRKSEFRAYAAMTPPRVLTSDGETANGAYRRNDVPDGALAGVGVSAGIVEGRARVVLDMADADLEPGDILVTAYTDPSWTPVFVAVAGLVTEIGGLMTHGAVIAREYGLPAVVGVVGATRLIEDGQRIRLRGTEGYVEIL